MELSYRTDFPDRSNMSSLHLTLSLAGIRVGKLLKIREVVCPHFPSAPVLAFTQGTESRWGLELLPRFGVPSGDSASS